MREKEENALSVTDNEKKSRGNGFEKISFVFMSDSGMLTAAVLLSNAERRRGALF